MVFGSDGPGDTFVISEGGVQPPPTPTPTPTPSPSPTPTATPTPTPTPTPGGLLFQDGFESGNFNSWTSTGGSGTHTQTVETANPHHGSYDAKITMGSSGEGWAQKTITSSPVVYLQQYIKLANLPSSGNRIYLGTIQSSNSNNNVDVFIENSGGQYYWGTYSSINGAVYHDRESSPSNPQAGVYYCVETCRDVTNSRSKLWVDGTLKVDVSRPHVGNANNIYSGISYTPNSATVYFDCVKVSTAYIEPEGTGQLQLPLLLQLRLQHQPQLQRRLQPQHRRQQQLRHQRQHPHQHPPQAQHRHQPQALTYSQQTLKAATSTNTPA